MCMMNSGGPPPDVEPESFQAGSGKTIKEKAALFKANKFKKKRRNLRINPT